MMIIMVSAFIVGLTITYMRASGVLARCLAMVYSVIRCLAMVYSVIRGLAMVYSVLPIALSTREDFSTTSNQYTE
jgi:hypothetical protein